MSKSLSSLVFSAQSVAGLPGAGQSFRPSGSCVVSFPVVRGDRWSVAVSLLSRSLRSLVIRHWVVRYGVRGHFQGFAVVISARGVKALLP